ncbi:MAG: sigma factor [Candidatus Margulisiibacteriota bacterium]
MKYDLFLDCDLDDKPVADKICAALAAGGLNCYYPRWFRLRTRGGYGQFVRDELEDSRMLMVVFSENAARPDSYCNVFLNNIDISRIRRKHVVAVVLDDAMVPMIFHDDDPLVHLVDLSTDAVEASLGMLAELARELTGRQARSIEEEFGDLLAESAASLTDAPRIEQVIITYMPLIKSIAMRVASRSEKPDIDDMINDGVVGLIKAVRDYSRDRGISFRSYAQTRILREITMTRWFPQLGSES